MHRKLEPHERGEFSQKRYFHSVAVLREETPPWFIGLIPADLELDLRGVDAIAYITYPGEYRMSCVPIQIKSSETGIKKYEETHKKYGGEHVVIVLVRDDIAANVLRRYTYAVLEKIRKENIRFDDYFVQLRAQPLTNGAEYFRQVRMREKMNNQLPKGTEPPELPALKFRYRGPAPIKPTREPEPTPAPPQPEVVAVRSISRWKRFWRALGRSLYSAWRWSMEPLSWQKQ